jgi:xylan 1,4-beta-xylosidase
MLWAPEIKYVKTDRNFYLTFSLWLPGGITFLYKSTTGKAEGSYVNVADSFLVRGIDGFIFEKDDNAYLLWGGGRLGKFKNDRSGFIEEPKRLLTVDNTHVGYEGNCLTKIKGKYVLSGAEWNGPLRTHGTYDMMYGISDNLWGPYTSPTLAVPHAGHGTVFQDKSSHWWTTID